MILPTEEYNKFMAANFKLLIYAGKKLKLFPENVTEKQFLNSTLEVKAECRNEVVNNNKLLDDFFANELDNLTTEDISILEGFRKRITGKFLLVKCLSKHAILQNVETNNYYAVLCLSTPLDEIFYDIPTLIYATILPFKGKIITDGLPSKF